MLLFPGVVEQPPSPACISIVMGSSAGGAGGREAGAAHGSDEAGAGAAEHRDPQGDQHAAAAGAGEGEGESEGDDMRVRIRVNSMQCGCVGVDACA